MGIIIALILFVLFSVAIAGAYYFGTLLEDSCGVKNMFVLGVAFFGAVGFIFWFLVSQGSPIIAHMFGYQ